MNAIECPTCRGLGELVDCPLLCDGSHIADVPYRCVDCDGTGERPVEDEQVAS